MGIHRIIIFLYLFTFISSLTYTGQSDTTYNEETGQYEFKLYFTNPSSIDDNTMFSFSQGVDADGNEENVVFCEINPIERRSLRSLNIRKLDVEITANCVYDKIKDPDKQIIFDNPEIRGVNDDIEIEGDFTVYFKKPSSSTSITVSSFPLSTILSTIQNSKISSGITTIAKSNPSSLLNSLLNPSIITSTTPKNNTNDTFLIYASKCEKIDFVEYLIEKGAFINAQNNELNTPLHYALKNRNFKISDLLLKAGANEKLVNKANLTPWQFMNNYDM